MPSIRRDLPIGRLAAEFLVIVVGVLTALGADAWWENRQERADEERILRVVLEDLRLDSAAFAEADTVWRGWANGAGWAVANLGRDVAVDSVEVALDRLFLEYFYPAPDAGYSSLTNAGRLDLVSDEKLQSQLVRWYERDQAEFGLIAARLGEVWLRMVDAIELDIRPGLASEASRNRLRTAWRDVPTDPRFTYRIFELFRAAGNFRVNPDYGLPRYSSELRTLRTAVEEHLETLR